MARPKRVMYWIEAGDYETLLRMAKSWATYNSIPTFKDLMDIKRMNKCEERMDRQKFKNLLSALPLPGQHKVQKHDHNDKPED